jgi:oligoendopeptidase F
MVDAVQQETGAEKITWDLSPLYSDTDDPKIQQDMQVIETDAEKFMQTYRGRISQLDVEELRSAIDEMISLRDQLGRLQAYAGLMFSVNTADPRCGALIQKVQEFNAKIGQYLVFFELEWNQVPDDQAQKLIDHPVLADYAHHLEAQRRYGPHQLPEDQEKIMIEKDVVGVHAWERFFDQITSAMRFSLDGEELTQSQILTRMFSPDRDLRQRAAQAVTEGLKQYLLQTTYVFNVIATNKAIDDRLRNYDGWISSRNLANKAPSQVVSALVEAVTSNYELVARHYRIKRVLLGLDELTDYDRYAPVNFDQSDRTYTWEEARDIVLKAFDAFDQRIGDIARRFFNENWIHAALQPNKRGGAFAHPVTPSVHPYIFLNFTGKSRDVMTLAHELGHGIHMYLSAEHSGLLGLYTPLTTAETASTFAEMLVFQDLLAQETDDRVRLSMLMSKLEDTFSTVFRQIAMNRFEHGLHTTRRTQGELGTEQINKIWMETQQAMFGDSVTITEDYKVWWSYIPHFVGTPGYVYAYAFGELLVLALYNIYQEGQAGFQENYIDVLKAGNSDYPDRIMARMGVDLNDPAFWQNGIEAVRTLVEQEEQLARSLFPEKF